MSVQHRVSSLTKGVIRISGRCKGVFLYIVERGMMSDFVPFVAPVAGVALTAICCAACSWCTAKRARDQTESFHQRLLVLEQAPAKVIVQGPSPPVYYPPPVAIVQPQQTQHPPRPTAPPAYPSHYPPYSTAYQGQQFPVAR